MHSEQVGCLEASLVCVSRIPGFVVLSKWSSTFCSDEMARVNLDQKLGTIYIRDREQPEQIEIAGWDMGIRVRSSLHFAVRFQRVGEKL